MTTEKLDYESDDLLGQCLGGQLLQHATILIVTFEPWLQDADHRPPDYMRWVYRILYPV